jgi:hypothetical protein
VGILLLDFHFSIARCSSAFPGFVWREGRGSRTCGNVGISPPLRDFQGALGRVENLLLVFQAFQRSVISTVPFRSSLHLNRGGIGDSILHFRKSFTLAIPIFWAESVSLIWNAIRSRRAKLSSGLKYCSASGSDFSFSYGVA